MRLRRTHRPMKILLAVAGVFLCTAAWAAPSPPSDTLADLQKRYSWNNHAAIYLTETDLADLLNRLNEKQLKGHNAEEQEVITLLDNFLHRYGVKIPFVMLDLNGTAAAYMPIVNGGLVQSIPDWSSPQVIRIAVWIDRYWHRPRQIAMALDQKLDSRTISVKDAWCQVNDARTALADSKEDLARLNQAFERFVTANSDELAALAVTDPKLRETILASLAHPDHKRLNKIVPEILTTDATFLQFGIHRHTMVFDRTAGVLDSEPHADPSIGFVLSTNIPGLDAYLAPTYMKLLPSTDGWSQTYTFDQGADWTSPDVSSYAASMTHNVLLTRPHKESLSIFANQNPLLSPYTYASFLVPFALRSPFKCTSPVSATGLIWTTATDTNVVAQCLRFGTASELGIDWMRRKTPSVFQHWSF